MKCEETDVRAELHPALHISGYLIGWIASDAIRFLTIEQAELQSLHQTKAMLTILH